MKRILQSGGRPFCPAGQYPEAILCGFAIQPLKIATAACNADSAQQSLQLSQPLSACGLPAFDLRKTRSYCRIVQLNNSAQVSPSGDTNLRLPMAPAGPSTTVVIPTYNEQESIAATITLIRERASTTAEIIVVDGHSHDATVREARRAGATVLTRHGGRAAQLNAGAAVAKGSTLLFLHADTAVPPYFDAEMSRTLAPPCVVAGAFRLRIDSKIRGIGVVEAVANWRATFLRRPYGDQGLFMSSDRFAEVGGYPNMPFLEDYEMVRRVKRRGRIAVARVPVVTSARRWETLGVVRTTVMNQIVIGAYHLGYPVEKLASWYRGALVRARAKRAMLHSS